MLAAGGTQSASSPSKVPHLVLTWLVRGPLAVHAAGTGAGRLLLLLAPVPGPMVPCEVPEGFARSAEQAVVVRLSLAALRALLRHS